MTNQSNSDPLLPEARPSLERPDQFKQLASDTFDFIAGDLFGMTPDPWICGEDTANCRGRCAEFVQRLGDFLRDRFAHVAAPPASSGRWTATWNMKFGAAIWYDGRIMFRVVAGAEDSRVTPEDPVPQWQKCVDAIIERMNQPAADPLSVSGTTPLKVGNLRRAGREDVYAMLSPELVAEIRPALDQVLPLLSDDECDREAGGTTPDLRARDCEISRRLRALGAQFTGETRQLLKDAAAILDEPIPSSPDPSGHPQEQR